MLFGHQPEPRRMSPTAIIVSAVLHLAVLGAFTYHPEPQLLQPTASLRGNGGSGSTSIVFSAPGASVIQYAKANDSTSSQSLLHRKVPKQIALTQAQAAFSDKPLKPGMPGFILGSLSSGFASDHDVRIALPVVAPDPPIVRAKLPDWIRGDVIVEVTIDETGIVTKTVVLKTVGFGLEDTVVETLYKWRFTPATIDGVAVASRQDVYFHFPS